MSEELVQRVRASLQRQVVYATLGNAQVARQHGLHVTDLQTLHLMVLRDDIRTPRHISTTTGLPTSTVTKVLDRLEQSGFLQRSPDPADRRKTRLELVESALAPLQTHYAAADEEFDELSRQFSSAELTVVARFLDAVNDFYSPKKAAG